MFRSHKNCLISGQKRNKCELPTIIHKISETESSFHVEQRTMGKV